MPIFLGLLSCGSSLFIGALLVFAAANKALTPTATAQAARDFGFNFGSQIIAVVVPLVEFALGVLLLTGTFGQEAATATTLLFAFFTVLVVRSVLLGHTHECSCFGSAFVSNVSWKLAARNGVLTILSVIMTVIPCDSSRRTALSWIYGLDQRSINLVELSLECVLITLGLYLAAQVARLHHDFRTTVSNTAQSRTPRIRPGILLPDFLLDTLSGQRQSLYSLMNGRSALVIFVKPKCEACKMLLSSGRLNVAIPDTHMVLISSGDAASNAALAEVVGAHVFLQQKNEVAMATGVTTTPSALLIGSDGTCKSPLVVGLTQISHLLDSLMNPPTLASPTIGNVPGLPPASSRH